ncbi:MAG: hypothetical protein V4597_08660 [Pseudomonadota bacterium]
MAETPEAVDVRRLRLRPGDVVVVKVEGRLSASDLACIEAELKAKIPDNQVLVIEQGVEIFTMGPEAEVEAPA